MLSVVECYQPATVLGLREGEAWPAAAVLGLREREAWPVAAQQSPCAMCSKHTRLGSWG